MAHIVTITQDPKRKDRYVKTPGARIATYTLNRKGISMRHAKADPTDTSLCIWLNEKSPPEITDGMIFQAFFDSAKQVLAHSGTDGNPFDDYYLIVIRKISWFKYTGKGAVLRTANQKAPKDAEVKDVVLLLKNETRLEIKFPEQEKTLSVNFVK